MNRKGTELEKYNPAAQGVGKYVPLEFEPQVLDKRDVLSILFKHKRKILSVFLATVAISAIVSFLIPPTYEARSSLMVKLGREYLNRSGMGDRPSILSLSQEELLNSEIQIIKNRDLIEKVLNQLKVEVVYPGLVKSPPKNMTPLQAAVLKAEKKLSVEGVKKSNVVEVAFQHEDPKVAALFVNFLVAYYKVKHLQVFSDPQSSFIDTKLSQFERKLKASEEQMETFRQKNRVYSLEEQRTLLLNQRNELDTALKNSRNQVDELQKRLASLRSQKAAQESDKAIYTTSERDKIIVDARAKLLSLQLREQELLKQYNEGNRLVRDVRDEIRLVQEFLKEQEHDIGRKVRTGSLVYQELEKDLIRTQAELSSQTARAAALKAQLAKVESEARSFSLLENEYQGLRRDVETNEKNYRAYLAHQEEARISEEMNRLKMANISVINEATPPVEKIRPKKALNILIGMFVGIVAGLGFALYSETSSQKFSSPGSVERELGLPVLTTILHKD